MDSDRRPSAFQTILNMFRLSNTPTVPVSEDEVNSDMDEPPDQVPELNTELRRHPVYSKSVVPPPYVRRESLLTKAIAAGANPIDTELVRSRMHDVSRALSTASSQSIPSTAELTSDCELTSPARSASPSPPPPASRLAMPVHSKQPIVSVNKVIIAPVTNDDKPAVVDVGEAAVEKTLGRKRCIMFACANNAEEATPKETSVKLPAVPEVTPEPQPQPRKCRLTFVCPTRTDSSNSVATSTSKAQQEKQDVRSPSPMPTTEMSRQPATTSPLAKESLPHKPDVKKPTPPQMFHEFGSSPDETDSWVDQPSGSAKPKLTLSDVMRKENAIRQIGEEAEAEAEEEQREQEDFEDELDDDDDNDGEDDFAPSDDDEDNASDGGNESDDEGGFADSDDESDAGSEYQFWAPSATTAATSAENLTHFSSRQRSRSSSLDSTPSQLSAQRTRIFHPRRASKAKAIRMRPGTPELPDSTDFVCGTLDEDRPLEAAYISCREQKKREKHITIPQDIDPSFPTTDPEDEEDEDEEQAEESEPAWVREQFGTLEDSERGRRRASAIRLSPQAVARKQQYQAAPVKRGAHRSPPPPPQRLRSPAPRRLFGHSPSRLRSPPPPTNRYRSPRGSPTNMKIPLGITINRLAQRPTTDRTASLPHTPNPFFRNWKRGSPATSRIPSGAVTPGTDEGIRPDLHVRGPVDIVIGLEKKRQKRKDKYWRQHCRKAAKEQAERRPTPGVGVERMKELGLECAERTRAYGPGQQQQQQPQQTKLVLSL